jgi:hypothetical protein
MALSKSKKLDLFRWIALEGNLTSYLRWRDNPITETLLDSLSDMNKPVRIQPNPADGKIDPMVAVQENAFRAGRDAVIDLLQHLDDFHSKAENSTLVDGNITDYLSGVEGYSEEDIKRIMKTDESEAM